MKMVIGNIDILLTDEELSALQATLMLLTELDEKISYAHTASSCKMKIFERHLYGFDDCDITNAKNAIDHLFRHAEKIKMKCKKEGIE